ncbi:MAG: L-threonylcarbamoyladenylate synthase [Bacteroidota bacterium]|nr:L-threonylcarbamoyladenylate synthase [Bacteroidota bacterium]
MLLHIHPDNPRPSHIQTVIDCLSCGGVIIYPTDTIYGLGCDINNRKAVERIAQIKGINIDKANLSLICYDLSNISDYTRQISNSAYKLMKKVLPGPYTIVLNANNNVPKLFQSKKKTVGIRVPDNNIARSIVHEFGRPIVSTSIRAFNEEIEENEYLTDPELIHEKFFNLVDIVIDGGYGDNNASTVVDCTDEEFKVLRYGKGSIDEFL